MTQLLIDRATLEQLVVVLEGVEALIEHQYTGTREGMNALQNASDDAQVALTAGRAALAQQELPQKERPDFMAGYDAGMADVKRMAQQGEQRCTYCHGCGIPAGDVHMSTCKSGKWPSRVSNGDTAAPAPQAQDWKKEPEYVPPLVKWAQEQPICKLFGTLPVYGTPAPQEKASGE